MEFAFILRHVRKFPVTLGLIPHDLESSMQFPPLARHNLVSLQQKIDDKQNSNILALEELISQSYNF